MEFDLGKRSASLYHSHNEEQHQQGKTDSLHRTRTVKTALKTTQQAAKMAQKTAQASAKDAKAAMQAAKATAKAVATGVKVGVKETIVAVKAIIAVTEAKH